MDLYIISPPACFLVGLSTVQLRGSCAQTHVVAKSYVLGFTSAWRRWTNIPPSIYCDSDACQFACTGQPGGGFHLRKEVEELLEASPGPPTKRSFGAQHVPGDTNS